ncbi:MAG: hypothetical protein PHQ65_01545 [Bacteroidales bacterium]|nr:hypothetical protein [Bacteroidales bacterium]MDD3663925.1 hypothetical protein [Bacteroidales bacterium]
MITHLTYDQINQKKWDECIHRAFNGRVYALSWYLNEISYGWEALVEGDYQAVMPLPGNRKARISYLFQPFFTQQLGIFSIKLISPSETSRFLNAIPSKYRYGELNLNSHNKVEPEGGFSCTFLLNHELDLIRPYYALKNNFSENTRRNIRRGSKNNLVINESLSPEELVTLFKNNRGAMLNHITEGHYLRLVSLMHRAIYHRNAFTIACYQNNNLLAGAFFLKYRNRLVFLFSAINDEEKKSGAMFSLIDHVIQKHSDQPVVLDFEGSNDPNLARFYKGFGASEVTYPRIVFNRLPYPLQITVNAAKKLRQIISF